MSFFKTIQALRPVNLLMTVGVMYAVRFGILDLGFDVPTAHSLAFTLYVFSVVCAMAFGYLVNDWYDVETDRINKPGQNIFVDGTPAPAYILMYVTMGISVILPVCLLLFFSAPFHLILLNVGACALLYVYARRGKGTVLWGNLLVAGLSGLLLLSVPLACMYETKLTEQAIDVILLYIVFSFFATLVREIVKDAEDAAGDAAAGLKTLATQRGVSASRLWAYTLLIFLEIVVLVAPGSYFGYAVFPTIAFGVLAITGIIVLFKLRKSHTKDDFKKVSRWLKLYMALGIISMLL